MEFLQTPIGMSVAGVVVLLLLIIVVARWRGAGASAARNSRSTPEIDAAVAKGQYERAAALAIRQGLLAEAMEYYLRAQQPENAAQVAVRMNKIQQAAELFARAENWERAIHFYEKCDMPDKAAELRKLHVRDAADARLAEGELRRAVPPAASSTSLSDEQLRDLAMQSARAAAQQLRPSDAMAALIASPLQSATGSAAAAAASSAILAVGLEMVPIQIGLLMDGAVQSARGGPSIDTLLEFLEGRECALQNIEVYYRLGLAHLAQGTWDEAMMAFDAVEATSPAYRDAHERADEIRAWKGALGERATKLDHTGRTGDGAPDTRYRIKGELGRGGMAVVYRAEDTLLGREVALKFLSEEFSSKTEMREMFQREARSVAQLDHPNIVTIHDYGLLEGRAFICMELVEGKSVEQLMSDGQGLTIVESLRIIKQTLDALEYAHGREIIHRDINPANIMRTTSGLVKLMDFGLAKSFDGAQKPSFIAGTPAYMAPEQLAGVELDSRCDIFAIGVTLYELLTTELPFEGLDRDRPPKSVREHVPEIPAQLDDAVMKAIDVDPDRRFASAIELREPIDQILDAVAQFAGASASVAPTVTLEK